jgi:MFS family permease
MSLATISVAVSINLILYGLMGPFAAALMQRLGVRTTVLISAATLTVGVALTPLMRGPWQLILLWGVVVGAGTGMTALVLGATVVNRWFTARRGLVMGILTASTATGQLVFLPLLAAMVERHGWRTATLVVAGAVLLIIPLVLLLLRERPEELLSWYYGLRGLSLMFLPYALDHTVLGLPLFAVFYGLDWIATVPPTVGLTANVFGRENAPVMFGWIVAAHQLGAATAAFGAGALRTALGGYVEAFTIAGALCAVAAVLVLGIDRRRAGSRVSGVDVEAGALA